jgi:hypothetical protein
MTKRAAQNRAAQVSRNFFILPIRGPLSKTATERGVMGMGMGMATEQAGDARILLTAGAIQRAFRQRKEGYIKRLEQQVKEYGEMEQNHNSLKAEIFDLRNYIVVLQEKILDLKGECPPPPATVHLNNPAPSGSSYPPPPATDGSAGNLAQVAQAVFDSDPSYSNKQFRVEAQADDGKAADAIARQLQGDRPIQPEGLPVASM